MALNQNYHVLWFESFRLSTISGHKYPIQLRLVAGQKVPKEIGLECNRRKIDPFDLLTECSKNYFYKYPAGTKFKLKAKLTDRQGCGMFFYSYFGWAPYETVKPA
jgi:hypothetical protein